MHIYVLSLKTPYITCYQDFVLTRVIGPNEQHMAKFACAVQVGGEIEVVRVTDLGHLKYGVDPGDVHVDRGPGTEPVPFDELTEFTVGAMTVRPVDYYRPGPDYVNAPPAQAVAILDGHGTEIVVCQDRSPDPGRTSGCLRAMGANTVNPFVFTGLVSYGLRGQEVPEEVIPDLIAGVSDGYPPVTGAAQQVDPIIQLLFSDDWEQ